MKVESAQRDIWKGIDTKYFIDSLFYLVSRTPLQLNREAPIGNILICLREKIYFFYDYSFIIRRRSVDTENYFDHTFKSTLYRLHFQRY